MIVVGIKLFSIYEASNFLAHKKCSVMYVFYKYYHPFGTAVEMHGLNEDIMK